MTWLSTLKRVVGARTRLPWSYEDERYSARCVIGAKPADDRWVATCQPAFNGEANGRFIALAGTIADEVVDLIVEVEKFYGTHEYLGWGGHEALGDKLAALRRKIEETT
jgi:hypothetical protein